MKQNSAELHHSRCTPSCNDLLFFSFLFICLCEIYSLKYSSHKHDIMACQRRHLCDVRRTQHQSSPPKDRDKRLLERPGGGGGSGSGRGRKQSIGWFLSFHGLKLKASLFIGHIYWSCQAMLAHKQKWLVRFLISMLNLWHFSLLSLMS